MLYSIEQVSALINGGPTGVSNAARSNSSQAKG